MKKAPTRAAPHPPTPRRRPDQKSLQAEATTCRDPGSVYCPGFFSVAVNAQKDILLICCSKVTGRGQNLPIRLSDTSSPLSRF